ncbi:MAG TPA: hypothetical protein VH309_03650 [Elusimicrobiota bacterium]|jgi:hypothetical protein|nr:hypothetical protein [Elusimicrobiota bacterium]
MRYWIHHRSRVIGPFEPQKLASIPAFVAASLVCSEESNGLFEKDWIQAGAVPELAEILSQRSKIARPVPRGYWALLEGAILGPYSPAQLWALPGVNLLTIVCPQSINGSESSDWKRIVECPELLEPSMGRAPEPPVEAGPARPGFEDLAEKQRVLEERLAKLETRPEAPPAPAAAPDADGLGMLLGGDSGGLSLGDSGGGLSGGGLSGGGDFSLGGGMSLGGDLGGGLSLSSEPAAAFPSSPAPAARPAPPPAPLPPSPPPAALTEAAAPAPPPALAPAPPLAAQIATPAPKPLPTPFPAPAPARAPRTPVPETPAPAAPRRWAAPAALAALLCIGLGAFLLRPKPRARREPAAALPLPLPTPPPAPSAVAEKLAAAPLPIPAPDPKQVLIAQLRAYAPAAGSPTLEKLLRSTLSSPSAADASRWKCVKLENGGGEVEFRSDRIDPESGGALVYRFRVEQGGRVKGLNLPARAILREP